jgi:hypothetical protein
LTGDLIAADNRAVWQLGEPPFYAADAALIAKAPELLAMLLELEWVANRYGTSTCPVCKESIGVDVSIQDREQLDDIARRPFPHADDCRLDALLKPFRETP